MNDPIKPPVLIRVENHLGHITLNRPRQINALTLEMIHLVQRALSDWAADPAVSAVLIDGAGERGLCAGGDIRMLYEGLTGKAVAPATFWSDEYEMNSTLAHYGKPIVAYQSGITLGGGLGISGHCSTRIVTESSQVGMPETAIGLCPDVGGLYLLARAPGELGTHAALTGARFGPADAIAAGLADHFVPADRLDELTGQLRSGVFPGFGSSTLAPGELAAQRDWIDDCYGGDDIDVILGNLRTRPEPAALATADLLESMSPTAVKVTLQAVRRAATLTLNEVLEQDFVVGNRFLRHPDLAEGIRAQVIDKDRQPKWNPARLDDVSDADVAAFFEPLESAAALRLTTR